MTRWPAIAAGLLIATVMLTASCTASTPSPRLSTVRECAQKGGQMQRGGLAGAWRCITPYADAGKSCTAAAQCLGGCIPAPQERNEPATGICKPDDNPFGCQDRFENGKVVEGVCVD